MPAVKAGFRNGDVIVRVGSTPVMTYMDVRDTMYKHNAGDVVKIEVVRDGQHNKTLSVTLADLPKAPVQTQRQSSPLGGDDPFGGSSPFQFQFPNGQGRKGNPQQSQPSSGHLGARIGEITDDVRAQLNLPKAAHGVIVASVLPGSLAESLGLEPGDVISKFGGQDVTTPEAVVKQIHEAKPGDAGSITYERYTEGGHMSTVSRTFNFK